MQFLPRGRAKTEPRHDLVRSACQLFEHRLRLPGIRRLAERLAVDDDLGVDAEHGPVAAVDRTSLARRQLDGIVAPLLIARCDDLEGQPELLEDRAPLRRLRGEDQRRCRRSRQISSSGQRFAHSAGTVE